MGELPPVPRCDKCGMRVSSGNRLCIFHRNKEKIEPLTGFNLDCGGGLRLGFSPDWEESGNSFDGVVRAYEEDR